MIRQTGKLIRRLLSGDGVREDYAARAFILDALPQHAVGAEIGVHEGEFSRLLLQRLSPSRLHLIDPWEYRPEPAYAESLYGGAKGRNQQWLDDRYRRTRQRLRKSLDREQVVIHRLRSANAVSLFPSHYFDWIYVDGDHQFDAVEADLRNYLRCVKPGGWIAGGGFRQGAWWGDGVVRAVNEFVGRIQHQQFVTHADQFLLRLAG